MQQSARFGIEHYSQLKELCNKKWDYHNAFFFTGTLATTIGYGNLVPKTDNGRIFCLCFCLIGEDIIDISYLDHVIWSMRYGCLWQLLGTKCVADIFEMLVNIQHRYWHQYWILLKVHVILFRNTVLCVYDGGTVTFYKLSVGQCTKAGRADHKNKWKFSIISLYRAHWWVNSGNYRDFWCILRIF